MDQNQFHEMFTQKIAADENEIRKVLESMKAPQSQLLQSRKIALKEALAAFYASDAGKMTVKELLTSTSNVALPDMVQAQALLEMGVWSDLREVSMIVNVPKGAGKTIETQVLTASDYDSWSEGSALAAADPTLAKRTITLIPFGKVTLISDLLANCSALNFVEQIGRLHGACVRKGIFDKTLDVMTAANGNTNSCASGSTLTFAEVAAAIKLNADDGYQSDYITCAPSDMWTAFTTTYAINQFTGALADMLATGVVPKALGLDWYADPYFTTARSAATKIAVVGTKGLSSVWGALQDAPAVELYRLPTALSNYVITHLDGGAAIGIVNSVDVITSAT